MDLNPRRVDVTNDATRGHAEISALQGFISDLISIQAIPPISDGRESSRIVGTLLDALVSVLRLDFAYAQLSDSENGPAVELARQAQWCRSVVRPSEVGRALEGVLVNKSITMPLAVPNPAGSGEIRIAPLRLGLLDEIGVLVAGSKRADFPTQTETLLLRVAANQSLVALLEAQSVNVKARIKAALQLRVIKRTEQSEAANVELRKKIAEQKQVQMELLAVRDELAAELKAMNRLHRLSARLLASTDVQSLLDEALAATMALQNADFGLVQLCDRETRSLELVAQRGFRQDLRSHLSGMHDNSAASGRAVHSGERVIIEDVMLDPDFAPHRALAASAGFRALQSTPLVSRQGEPLGIISTHFRVPCRPTEHQLRLTDLYARQVVEMLERNRGAAALTAAKSEAERGAREAEKAQSILLTIMEHAPAGITLTGGPPEFPIIANSKHVAKMVGREASTLLHIPSGSHAAAYGILHSATGRKPHPEELPLYRSSRYGEVIENEEWIIERPDGSRINTLSNVAPIRDFNGQVIGAINCWRDITGRKRAEEALRASEERFRRYFNLGLIGMAITAPAKGSLEVNDELCRMLRYERNELLEKNWPELTHPDDLAADLAQFNRVLAGEIDGYTIDKRWIRKDGSIINSIMSAKCVRRSDSGIDYVIALVLDVTARRRAEEALRRSEANLAEGQRLSHTGSWAWNVASGEAYWSAELFRIYGLDPAQVTPGYPNALNYIHPEDRQRVQTTFENAVREEREQFRKLQGEKNGHAIGSLLQHVRPR